MRSENPSVATPAMRARPAVGEVFRQVGRTIWFCAEVLVAARLPLRAIRHDVPHAPRHLTEVDLGDRKDLVAEDADVHLTTVDEPLNEHFVPAFEHRLNPGVEAAHASHD